MRRTLFSLSVMTFLAAPLHQGQAEGVLSKLKSMASSVKNNIKEKAKTTASLTKTLVTKPKSFGSALKSAVKGQYQQSKNMATAITNKAVSPLSASHQERFKSAMSKVMGTSDKVMQGMNKTAQGVMQKADRGAAGIIGHFTKGR